MTLLNATGMHFRDDYAFLRNPTDPSRGGKPTTFPFHNAGKAESPFPHSLVFFLGAEACEAAVLSPTWLPDNCHEEEQPPFPAHVVGRGCGQLKGWGSPAARGG